jgi:glycosyltransferase involved in cell wall biosynthesis
LGTSVSVLVTVRNCERYIRACLLSILNQVFTDFEIIVVDDISDDKTQEIISQFTDPRIKYFKNERLLGLAASRNQCLKYASGDYVFFTDADCTVSKNWIDQGLKYLRAKNCIGVEGRTVYVSEQYMPTRSDDVVENNSGGQYPTCNMAYIKKILNNIGGFYDGYTYLEDRDLALRAKKLGKILFNPHMLVFHQKKVLTPIQLVRKARNVRNRVLLYKKLDQKDFFIGRILYPLNLIAILFPPLIIRNLFSAKYKSEADFALFPFFYLSLVYERLNIWDMSVRERVFVL